MRPNGYWNALATIPLLCALLIGPGASAEDASAEDEVAAARALFQANLDAIRNHDREAYLACYLQAGTMAITGPQGFRLGYEEFAAGAGDSWPDVFEGRDLQLVRVRPGVVYGTYRYRVVFEDTERIGISERFFVETENGWRIAVTSAFDAPQGTPPPPLALVGATLVDGTGARPVPESVVLLRGGKIDCSGTRAACEVPDGVETVDLSEKWITPGLVDAHVHFSQTGWADGRPDSLDMRAKYPYEQTQAELRANPDRWLRSYLCSGVTAVFDVGGYPWTWGLQAAQENDTRAPRVSAAGPLLSTLDFWLNLPAERQFIYLADEQAGRDGVGYLAAHGAGAVKVWFVNRPDMDFDAMAAALMAAGEETKKRGLPLIVHATGLREAKVAVRAGAHLLVHSVTDKPVDDEFMTLARDQGTIYCPTLIVRDGYVRMYQSVATGRPPSIDDPNSCLDAGILERVAETASASDMEGVDPQAYARRVERIAERTDHGPANLQRLHQAGIPIAMGTDAGNPLTLHGPSVYAEMEAMQAAGMNPLEVLGASTRGGAMAMGRLDDFGTVEAGKLADLLIVRADPTADIANMRRLHGVVRGGVLRGIEELRVRR